MASSRLEKIGTIFTRKRGNDSLLRSLSAVLMQLEADGAALKENEQRLQHLTAAHMKCIQQASAVHKQRLQALKEIQLSFKKQVEGLLTKGALKPDERPIWFDIYKKFPPIVEPKYARPKPEIKEIRQIFYHEDTVRVQFHSQGMGLGAVNMLASGDTQTKKLLQQYNKLKAEGIPESEIINKCVAIVESEKEKYIPKITDTVKPKSITQQVLTEADIKNIFNDQK